MLRKFLAHPRQYLKNWRDVSSLRTAARRVNTREINAVSLSSGRLLVLPCDPWTLDGSKGDEAMIQGLITKLRIDRPDLEVGVVVASDQARARAKVLGFAPIDAWDCGFEEAVRAMLVFGPEMMVTIGADVMDGYYSPLTTSKLLLLSDAMARRGVRTIVSGFSFNASANSLVRDVFDELSARTKLNVRDPISFDRFQRFTRTPARLVADAAFLLEPRADFPAMAEAAAWVQAQHDLGHTVLGFNMHPMLIKNASSEQLARLIDASATSISAVTKSRPISFLFLPHDFRGKDGDDACLGPIFRAVSGRLGDCVRYDSTPIAAANLKALAGLVDGVVTARMHLAIAALGMGRPVASLTYQDKFQGLFAHFDYPERFLLDPQGASDDHRLTALLTEFVDHLPSLTKTVAAALPQVKQASAAQASELARAA